MKGLRTIIVIEVQIILILLAYLVWKTIELEEKVRRTNIFVHEAIRDTRFEELNQINEMDILLGDANASGTIIMYTKVDCAFCTGFFRETFPGIDSAYLKTGKIKFIIRYLPEHHDSSSLDMIRYAYCLNEQGIFGEYQRRLNAEEIDRPGLLFAKDLLKANAKDTSQLAGCLKSQRLDSYLTGSAITARQAGVNVTPFFIINGKVLRGDRKFSKFKELIDQG
ncbi:MAG: thioredoxin domain-containing protein [Saprospiraceae bacterium]